MANDLLAAQAATEIASFLKSSNYVDDGTWQLSVGYMPDDPDSVVAITPAGGPADEVKSGLQHPQVQIRIRGIANDVTTALVHLRDIIDALELERNVTLGSGQYAHILPVSNILPLGRDKNNRFEYTVTMQAARTPV